MPDAGTLALFAISTLALLAVPGPSAIFVVIRSLEYGRRAGLVSMLGVETGTLVHVAVAAAGLSALVASSPAAVSIMRWVGGGYLLWLGASALRRRGAGADAAAQVSSARLFRQGVLVDVLNPKTALFFLAFLPGFVHAGRGSIALQTAVLGICFVLLAALIEGTYALLAARMSRRFRAGERRRARASAGTYGLLGVFTLAGGA